MKKLKIKKIIAVMTALTSMMILAACGSSDVDSTASNQSDSNVEVTESETAIEEDKTNREESQISTDVSMEGLLSHAETPAEDFTYYISNDIVIIDGYIGTDPIVVIPESIEGYPVKSIINIKGKGIQAIKFSDSMEAISESLFLLDEDIQYVVFGANVKIVGKEAFYICPNMKEIQLNDSLEVIEQAALATNSKVLTDLYIPESVTEINAGLSAYEYTLTHVKAGSCAEEYCKYVKEGNDDFTYVVE